MGERIRSFEWSKTPVGPICGWSQSFKTAVGIMLGANTPIAIYWGSDYILLYNDCWRDLIGQKHPHALGQSGRDVFPEIWDVIEPMFGRVMAGKGAEKAQNQCLSLNRSGRTEEAWFEFTFNPLLGEDGTVNGIFNIASETTKQMRAAETLREQKFQYRTLAELCPEAILVNAQGRFVYANMAAARLLAANDPQDLLDLSPYDLLDPEYHELVRDRIQQVLRKDCNAPRIEVRWRRFDGSYADIDVFAGPVTWGGTKAIQVVARDITEYKRKENALRESEAHKSFILQLSDSLRSLADPFQIQEAASQVLAEHINTDRSYYGEIDEIEGLCTIHRDYVRNDVPSISGTHRLSDLPCVFDTLRSGCPVVISDISSEADFSDRERSYLESLALQACIAVPLVKQGKLVAILAVSEVSPRQWTPAEVSLLEEVAERTWAGVERTLAQEALRESEARFRALVTASSEVMFRMSPDWSEILYLHNEGFLARKRKSDPNWRQNWLHPEDMAYVSAVIEQAIRAKTVIELEHRVRKVDGSWGWAFSRAVPLLNAHGEIVEWFGAISDITARREAGEALKEAKAAAENANCAKSEFLANMSHELRTPMTVFLGVIQHLLQSDRNPERRRLLEMADQSAKRLRTLIEDVLDFSCIEARKVKLEEKPFDLCTCIHEAVELFTLPAEEKNLRLETQVAPDVPEVVVGDPDRLAQVLVNLVGNAVKFTHEGSVQAFVESCNNGFLKFSVCDTGVGVPQDEGDRVFESFHQVDSSLNRGYGGKGLGLAISKELVELMGGEMSFSSKVGKGSVFSFVLPLKAAGNEQIDETPPEKSSGDHFQETRILLAEDEIMIQELFLLILSQRGCQTQTAVSGREAVEMWEKGDFDIILMDLQMPEMSGLEATRAIRSKESEREKKTCIVGLTAHAREEILEKCLA
ncbi:MAG: PAS domain S-box protein, partial [Desulfuromonadales bacterium]